MRNDELINSVKNAFAGGCAGLASSIITCPLDMIKIRLQNKPAGQKPLEIFNQIWRQEGIRGLYRGVWPTITGYLPTWGIYFVVYDSSKKSGNSLFSIYLSNLKVSTNTTFLNVMAALQAGLASTAITNPLWVVRSNISYFNILARMMTQSLKQTADVPYFYTSPFHAIKTIIETEGWKTLYKGLIPSLLGVSHVAIQFPIYEHLKAKGAANHGVPSSFWILGSSALSKMIASSITYPHEVIRTRLHTQTAARESLVHTRYLSTPTPKKPKYHGLIHTAVVIAREEGYGGFYKGFGINLVRTVPASALTILTYELVRSSI